MTKTRFFHVITLNLSYAIVMICFLFTLVCGTSAVYASVRTALVIGNGRYRSSPLGNPVNDANDIAKELKRLGFDVILKKNADKRTMINALRLFGRKLSRSRIGLFYFAGHGMQIKGDNYLIPVKNNIKAAPDVEFEAVNANRILAEMETAGNPMNIVILDACRNNPFKRSFRTVAKGLAKMDAPPGTIIAYATSPGSVAEDGQGRNGTYTSCLLKNFGNPELDVQKMFNQTGLDVMHKTHKTQVPWVSTSPFPDYYLVPGAEAKTVSALKSGSKIKPAATLTVSHKSSSAKSWPGRHPLDINTLLARAEAKKTEKERELARAKAEKEQKFAKERQRKTELKQEIEKYNLLIKNYGYQYKDQAWQAICNDFPALTSGLETGDVSGLKRRAGLHEPGDVWTEPVTGMEFVWVPKGCFEMGQTNEEKNYLIKEAGRETYDKYFRDELPRHRVCVDGFWIGKYEVTQGQWKKIMHNNLPHFKTSFFKNFFKNRNNYPVERVSWYDAQGFISQLNQKASHEFALPTETQWEYAARSGGKNQKYSGGNNADSFAWYNGNSGGKAHPVGTKAPNGLGIYDMSGNVREWCEDVYDEDAYSKHDLNNPVVEYDGTLLAHVYRGGSWYNDYMSVRCANRGRGLMVLPANDLGFRLIRKN